MLLFFAGGWGEWMSSLLFLTFYHDYFSSSEYFRLLQFPWKLYPGPTKRKKHGWAVMGHWTLDFTKGTLLDTCVNMWVSCRELYRSRDAVHSSGGFLFLKSLQGVCPLEGWRLVEAACSQNLSSLYTVWCGNHRASQELYCSEFGLLPLCAGSLMVLSLLWFFP